MGNPHCNAFVSVPRTDGNRKNDNIQGRELTGQSVLKGTSPATDCRTAFHQNDFEDCYGDQARKIGTDIKEGTCTWLIVQALARGNEDQITILKENYGHQDDVKVSRVEKLYRELDLTALYEEYKKTSYGDLMKLIDRYGGNLPQKMFIEYAMECYKRQ